MPSKKQGAPKWIPNLWDAQPEMKSPPVLFPADIIVRQCPPPQEWAFVAHRANFHETENPALGIARDPVEAVLDLAKQEGRITVYKTTSGP